MTSVVSASPFMLEGYLTVVALKIGSRLRYLCKKSLTGIADRSVHVAAKVKGATGVMSGM
jgi:hypothetical protein